MTVTFSSISLQVIPAIVVYGVGSAVFAAGADPHRYVVDVVSTSSSVGTS